MKVIELLNKIANGEVEQDIEFFHKKEKYRHIDNLFGDYYVEEVLNDEVEIIDKKIEKIEKFKEINMFEINENGYVVCEALSVIIDKINEIIDKVNKGE